MISLFALLILRVYSAFFTVPIVTWDDTAYRAQAISLSANYSCAGIVKETVFPHPTYTLGKITNYVNWLVVGLKFMPALSPETVFQIVNLLFFVTQFILIYKFTFLATGDKLFSLLISFLFMSSPLIFGISRWVLTENLVYTCLLGCLYFSLLLIRLPQNKSKFYLFREAILTVTTAYVLIISATAREYIVFTPAIFSIVLLAALILQKRWVSVFLFATMLLFFSTDFADSIQLILAERTGKLANTYYYSPPLSWLGHVALHAVGIAFLLLFIALFYAAAKEVILKKNFASQIKNLINPESIQKVSISLLLLSHLFLFLIYSFGICSSYNRGMRPAMLPFFSLLGFFIIFLCLKPEAMQALKRNTWMFLFLTALSWAVLYYQLFVAFDGGKTFAHHAYKMEYFNYPMHLRPLTSPSDMHVCGTDNIPCPFESK